jgi:hypothetical protein
VEEVKIRIGLMIFTIMLVSFGLTPHLWGAAEFKEFEKVSEEMKGFRSHWSKVSKSKNELRDARERHLNAQTDQEKLDSMADQSKALVKIIFEKDNALKALRRGIASINAANSTDSSDGSQLDKFLGGRISDIKALIEEFRAEKDDIIRSAKSNEDGKLTEGQKTLVKALDYQAAGLEKFAKNCEEKMKYSDLDAEGVAKIKMTVLDKWRLTFTAAERNLAATLTHDEMQLKFLMTTYQSLNMQKTFQELVEESSPGEDFSVEGMVDNIDDASREFDTTMKALLEDVNSIKFNFEWDEKGFDERVESRIKLAGVAPQAGDVKDQDMVYEYWDGSKKRWWGTSDGKVRTKPRVYAPYDTRTGSGLYVEYKEEDDAWYTFYLGGPSGDEMIYERIFTESELGLSPDEEL